MPDPIAMAQTTVTADPNGDIAFVLGSSEDATHVQVNSQVLKLASPVLTAMFGPHFAEGQGLSSNSSKPVQVPLPDDNPEAMVWILLALHYCEKPAFDIPLRLLLRIAVHCDKYDLTRALRGWGDSMLRLNEETSAEESEFTLILASAYSLNNHESFWRSSRWLLVSGTLANLGNGRKIDDGDGRLPEGLIGL